MEPIGKRRCVHASAKRRLKSNHFSNNLSDQTRDALYNPENPVNPDSKPNCNRLPKLKQRIANNIREIS